MEDYYNKAITFQSLYEAGHQVCNGVRWKESVARYEADLVCRTWRLKEAIDKDKYHPHQGMTFRVFEPKERTIIAPTIVDRQVQRALCNAGLYEDFVEHYIRNSSACQKGRGTDDALNRMKILLSKYYRHYKTEGWFLKCDIHHYFHETPHSVAKAIIHKYIKDEQAAAMVCEIIDSFDGDIGIGLGSQISQLIELSVLNDLDHYIKECLHIKYYIRYMDDFILIHHSKQYLQYCKIQIRLYLIQLGLTLNKKTTIQPLYHGTIFLQWKYVVTNSGKVLMLYNTKKLRRKKSRLRKLYLMEKLNEVPPGTTRNSFECIMANIKRGNTYKIQQSMKLFYYNLAGEIYYDRKIQKNKTRRSTKCGNRAIS